MGVTRIKDDFVMVDKEFMDIALENMKRVQELEKRSKVLRNDLTAIKTLRKKEVKQNKRYREAIEKIRGYNRKALIAGNGYTNDEALLDISLEIGKLEGEE